MPRRTCQDKIKTRTRSPEDVKKILAGYWPNPRRPHKIDCKAPRIGRRHVDPAKYGLARQDDAPRACNASSHRYITRKSSMSKAFLSQVLKESVDLTGAAANRAAGDLMDAIVKELKKSGKFTLPSFGTFSVRKTKARKGLNPRTGESIKVKAGKTVRFKASPTLKKAV
jgi:DNA-binding protein HU-beta